MEKFEGHNTGVGHDISSREQQENNARTNQLEQQAPQDVIYGNGTAQQQLQQSQYEVGKTDADTLAAATSMSYMPSIRELGYLNQTSLLRKDFKIRGVISNAGQKDRLNFVSLSHQINDKRTSGYSEKIMAGRCIPFKAGESVVACVLTKVRKPNRDSEKHKGVSRDFRKKTRFKLKEDEIAANGRSEGTHFVSSETREYLFSIVIPGSRVVFILTSYLLLTSV